MTGPEFQTHRRALGYKTRKAVADEIGVAVDTVKKWETGKRRVPVYAVKVIGRLSLRPVKN